MRSDRTILDVLYALKAVDLQVGVRQEFEGAILLDSAFELAEPEKARRNHSAPVKAGIAEVLSSELADHVEHLVAHDPPEAYARSVIAASAGHFHLAVLDMAPIRDQTGNLFGAVLKLARYGGNRSRVFAEFGCRIEEGIDGAYQIGGVPVEPGSRTRLDVPLARIVEYQMVTRIAHNIYRAERQRYRK